MMKEFEYTGKAMGVEYSVAIVCDSEALAEELFRIAKADIEAYEARFSRFLPTSELSLLNERKNMIVSQIFLTVTQQAYQLFNKTKGIFNPLVQITRLGYNQTFDELKNSTSIDNDSNDNSLYDIDFSTTIIDSNSSRIILQDGQQLDFGGFLKGYLAELITKKLISNYKGVSGVIVNLGGDIHTQGLDENGENFLFNIYNPILDNEDTTVTLHNQSLATSGTYKRTWLINGQKIHHILDASGNHNPQTDIVSASVVHENGATAEAFAKVLLTIGKEETIKIFGQEQLLFTIVNTNGKIIKNIL